MAEWTKALDAQVTRAINNPKTTCAALGVFLCAVGAQWHPKLFMTLGLGLSALGHFLSADAPKQ